MGAAEHEALVEHEAAARVGHLFLRARITYAELPNAKPLNQGTAARLASRATGVHVTRHHVRRLEQCPTRAAHSKQAKALAQFYGLSWERVLRAAGVLKKEEP